MGAYLDRSAQQRVQLPLCVSSPLQATRVDEGKPCAGCEITRLYLLAQCHQRFSGVDGLQGKTRRPFCLHQKPRQRPIETPETASTCIEKPIAGIGQSSLMQYPTDFVSHPMRGRACECTIHRPTTQPRLADDQPGQCRTGAGSQPPAVVIAPSQLRKPSVYLLHQGRAPQRSSKPTAALGHAVIIWIALLPGVKKVRAVTFAVAAIPKPVQLHAEALQILDGGRLLRLAAEQPDAGQTKAFRRRCQRMKMIGVWAAKADQPWRTERVRCIEMMRQLEPLVTGQFGIEQIKPKYDDLHVGFA